MASGPKEEDIAGENKQASSEAENEAKAKELVRIIGPAVFLNVLSGAMLYTSRQASAKNMFKSGADLTMFLAKLSSGGAFLEFILNPIIGKLSDAYGRRPFIPLANVSTLVCRLFLFLKPTSLWPLVAEQLITTPLITAFFTTYRAAVSDVLQGETYTKVQAQLGVCAGVAIMAGPLLSHIVMSRMHPRYCFLVASVLSGGCLVHLSRSFKETLAPEKRKTVNYEDMRPWSFVQLMKSSSVMMRLMTVIGFQTATEGRNITDIVSTYLQSELQWDWARINKFVGAYGVALVASGLNVKRLINALGLRNFTVMSNTVNALAMLCYACPAPFNRLLDNSMAMWIGLMISGPGARKRDAVEAMIMKRGRDAGLGGGYVSGCMMNWRACINVLGPVLFGTLYAHGTRMGLPGLPFLVASLTSVAATGVLNTMNNAELGLNDAGFAVDGKSR
eukprot:m.278994 g.278994  ORF g.278994 m.278994 type:complete len:447 (+) comp19795_c0_seq1:198-1538(+)